MKYAIFKFLDGGYYPTFCDDEQLAILVYFFDESNYFLENVKNGLEESKSKKFNGNGTILRIQNHTIKIECSYDYDIEDKDTFEIKRNSLIELINKWQEMVKQKVPEIFIIWHDDGTITVTDTMP